MRKIAQIFVYISCSPSFIVYISCYQGKWNPCQWKPFHAGTRCNFWVNVFILQFLCFKLPCFQPQVQFSSNCTTLSWFPQVETSKKNFDSSLKIRENNNFLVQSIVFEKICIHLAVVILIKDDWNGYLHLCLLVLNH